MDIEKLFPDNRLDGDTEHERGQLVLSRMYRVFVYLCNTHKIRWWATGGLCLAALRGQDILPWSGDLDVVMPRQGLNRFIDECVPKLPKSMFFQSSATDPFLSKHGGVRLRDRYSNYYEHNEWLPLEQHNGLQIDIFVRHPNAKFTAKQHSWDFKDTFPLIKTPFLDTQCNLPHYAEQYCAANYGEDFMSVTRTCHSGKWHTTQPCEHPESLDWPPS